MNSKGKQRKVTSVSCRKAKSKVEEKCIFCFSSDRDVLKFGKMFKYKDIYVHYYCLLLSSALVQKGKDNEGIFGFLAEDIRKEAKRGEKLRCAYCRTNGATIGCSVKTCKTSFHLPCGIKNKALNEFYNKYDSYCFKHRERQEWNSDHPKNEDCPTCYCSVEFDTGIEVLATPCCHKLFHRTCIQKQALSAGSHHFKCPLCCNKDNFKERMMKLGIHVPIQDASWEMENNAYGDLYVRHSTCDRDNCLCPNGRSHRERSGDWQLLICETCGSKGSHWKCLSSHNWIDEWVCDECKETLEKQSSRSDQNSSQDSPVNADFDDDDNEIIEIVSDGDISSRFSDSSQSVHSRRTSSQSLSDLNKGDDFETQRVKRLKTEIQMKDMAVQCVLVSAEDLLDMDPIEKLNSYELKNSIITINNYSDDSNKEVIDIDDSDDDDIILLN